MSKTVYNVREMVPIVRNDGKNAKNREIKI